MLLGYDVLYLYFACSLRFLHLWLHKIWEILSQCFLQLFPFDLGLYRHLFPCILNCLILFNKSPIIFFQLFHSVLCFTVNSFYGNVLKITDLFFHILSILCWIPSSIFISFHIFFFPNIPIWAYFLHFSDFNAFLFLLEHMKEIYNSCFKTFVC